MLETDVLIVGGGPAGSTTAKYLSKNSVENILIQRNFGFKKPCGGGIRMDAFSEFDVDEKLVKKRVDVVGLVFKERRVDIDISATPLAVVDRVEFDSALRDDAERLGTELYEASFVSMERFDEYVVSVIKKGDEYVKVKSNYVVAADGVNSKIRKLVNGDSVSSSLTHYADIRSKTTTSCDFHFGQSVAQSEYAWDFPHADGSNIGTVVDDLECLKSLKSNLNIDEKTRDLGYKIPVYKNQLFYKDRVFFVGDSASQVLPFTYEGIYYAMSSAKILSNVLVKKLSPFEYEKEWKKVHKERFDTLLKLQKIFLHNDFMISIMMKLYKSSYMQKQMLELWLGKREVKIDARFFFNIAKRYLFKRA